MCNYIVETYWIVFKTFKILSSGKEHLKVLTNIGIIRPTWSSDMDLFIRACITLISHEKETLYWNLA